MISIKSMAAANSFLFLLLLTKTVLLFRLASSSSSSSTSSNILTIGSSLSVENYRKDILTSTNGVFSAGFFPVGQNAYCFAVWFTEPVAITADKLTVVWMANRDQPVNGRRSKLTLQGNGNLLLTDVGKYTWSSNTVSNLIEQLVLKNTGNLVLQARDGNILWESFDSPTDTLLPQQALTRNTRLVSSRSLSNYSSGFYELFFDNDNTLRLLYNGLEDSSIYWPLPWLINLDAGRYPYNNTRIATFDALGKFSSSDDFAILSSDYGAKGLQRIMKVDVDGNLRLYSRNQPGGTWAVRWQALSRACKIHGLCGANSWCSTDPSLGRKCSCLPGYKMVNKNDWSHGCEPDFTRSCDDGVTGFMHLPRLEIFGFDYGFYPNTSLHDCKSICSGQCNCTGFQYKFDKATEIYSCYLKFHLANGHRSPEFNGDLYIKLPKSVLSSYNARGDESNFTSADESNTCSDKITKQVERIYEKRGRNGYVFILKFAAGFGGVEIVCIFLVWFFLNTTKEKEREDSDFQGYLHAASGFRRFSYSELNKATKGFKEEIGRGGGGVVYKGKLSDRRVAAIKQLNAANQGEAEFLAEVSLIGKLYHMNLIELWGYCVEKNYRLLVYEYMEHGSLAKYLSSDVLDSKKRFDIALGTAKGLAYLHEECLDWVLHCDVKPENILLDSEYNPKVGDFGLSKLLNRGELRNSNFSRIRGTRGYMAPEWVQNMPITSKVDVYSYGIVVLEMLTGMKITNIVQSVAGGGESRKKLMLVTWVKEKMNVGAEEFEKSNLKILVEIALQCLEEDKDARPTMSQVVEILSLQ